jgi:TrkA family protein
MQEDAATPVAADADPSEMDLSKAPRPQALVLQNAEQAYVERRGRGSRPRPRTGSLHMAVILLLTVVLASYICVRVGAVAFELTGIPWEQAKFQALSAFSNCGFTTRETEDIVAHPLRRRIASYLIILGNAGVVTTIATFASALVGAELKGALINLASISAFIGFVAWLAKRPILARQVRLTVQRWLAKRADFQPSTEALLRVDQGYCVTRLFLAEDSALLGQTLSSIQPGAHKLQILAIERDERFIPIPEAGEVLRSGDTIVVYGTDASVQAVFGPIVQRHLGLVTRLGTVDSSNVSDDTQGRARPQPVPPPVHRSQSMHELEGRPEASATPRL